MTTEEKYLMRLELCSKKGFSARMQEIADEAGINKAMLHYCFKTNNFFLKQCS
jgi:AcrR family transcriptional regulator